MTMTLHTLKSLADHAPKKHKVPGIKQLESCGSHIIVREMIGDLEITAFQNGFVACRREKYTCVFRLHDCGGYYYQTAITDTPIYLPAELFENESWYIRLYLEGEDSLNKNYERKQRRNTMSYADGMEEYINAFADLRMEGLKVLLAHEDMQLFLERLSHLSEKQRLALQLYYLNGLSLADCATIYGATERAVSDVLHRAIRNLLSMYGLPTEDISLSYHQSWKGGEKNEQKAQH